MEIHGPANHFPAWPGVRRSGVASRTPSPASPEAQVVAGLSRSGLRGKHRGDQPKTAKNEALVKQNSPPPPIQPQRNTKMHFVGCGRWSNYLSGTSSSAPGFRAGNGAWHPTDSQERVCAPEMRCQSVAVRESGTKKKSMRLKVQPFGVRNSRTETHPNGKIEFWGRRGSATASSVFFWQETAWPHRTGRSELCQSHQNARHLGEWPEKPVGTTRPRERNPPTSKKPLRL